MGMTIDEVIKRYKNDAEWERSHNNTDYYEEYKQIAEWLEKYQKIEQIISDGYLQGKSSGEMLLGIKEVLHE